MNILKTEIPDVLILEPQVFGDERGFFMESFNQQRWEELTGLKTTFVQDNHSRSQQGCFAGFIIKLNTRRGNWFAVFPEKFLMLLLMYDAHQ